MISVHSKIFGENSEVVFQPADMIKEALDLFLTSAYPDILIKSVVVLNIGLETYIKKELDKKEPGLIHKLDKQRWEKIKSSFANISKPKEKRTFIKSEIGNLNQLRNGTTNYSIVLEILPIYFRVSQKTINDLEDLRLMRNDVFHFMSGNQSSFSLSKKSMRIFTWLFTFMEKNIGHDLGDEWNIIDPLYVRRNRFMKLKNSIKSETLLNVQRRIFYYNENFQNYYQIKSYIEGRVFIPDAIEVNIKCPACNNSNMEVYESGSKRNGKWEKRFIFIKCKACQFFCSDKEFEIIKSENHPSLEQLFSQNQQ